MQWTSHNQNKPIHILPHIERTSFLLANQKELHVLKKSLTITLLVWLIFVPSACIAPEPPQVADTPLPKPTQANTPGSTTEPQSPEATPAIESTTETSTVVASPTEAIAISPTIPGPFDGNFTCEEPPEPIVNNQPDDPDALITGRVILCGAPYPAVDLETGSIGMHNIIEPELALPGADFILRWGTTPEYWFEPAIDIEQLHETGTVVYLSNYLTYGKEMPTKENCSQEFSTGRMGFIVLDRNFEGEYICVTTDQGRLGYVRFERIDPLGQLSLDLSFLLWK